MQPFVGVGQVVLTYAGFKGILRVYLKCLKTPDTESLRIRSSKQSQQSAAQEDFLLIISSMTTLILPDPLPALLRCLKMLPGLHFNGLTLSAPADLTAALQKAKRP